MPVSKQEILHAYRHLYRAALEAVRYSKPARYTVRRIVSQAFRHHPPSAFNPARVSKTLAFLQKAKEHNGYEHKILKNLLKVRYWQDSSRLPMSNDDYAREIRLHIRLQYAATLTMFNESFGTCLWV